MKVNQKVFSELLRSLTYLNESIKAIKKHHPDVVIERDDIRIKWADDAIKNANESISIECDNCDGDGYLIESCCGDDIKGNDIDLCPTCGEHCSLDEHYTCDECNGTGMVLKIQI